MAAAHGAQERGIKICVVRDKNPVFAAELKEFEKAINDYNQAIELDPFDPQLFFNRGLALANSGLINDAIKDFEECLAIDPQNHFGQKGLAVLALEKLRPI